jgi:hypothetical protein
VIKIRRNSGTITGGTIQSAKRNLDKPLSSVSAGALVALSHR